MQGVPVTTAGMMHHPAGAAAAVQMPVAVVQQQTAVSGFPKKSGRGLAYTQLICGIICIVLEVINLATCGFPVAAGIWGGIMYTATGIVGIFAAKQRSRCLIIAFMVLSIISAVTAAFALSMSIANTTVGCYSYYRSDFSLRVIPIILSLTGLTEFVIAIVSSSVCCKATCGCCSAGSSQQTVIYYSVGSGPAAIPISGGPGGAAPVLFVQAPGMPAAPAPLPTAAAPLYTEYPVPVPQQGGMAGASGGTGGTPPPSYDGLPPTDGSAHPTKMPLP